jgi:uncharacterized protein
MRMERILQSALDPDDAAYRHIIPAGEPWLHELYQGEVLRIVDLEGNQTAETLFYNAHDYSERYSAQDTIRTQRNINISTGTHLISTANRVLFTIVADTCGRHDTLGGACATESNMVRYALDKGHLHSCLQNFVKAVMEWGHGMSKRDIATGVSFFRSARAGPEGTLSFAGGVSEPGDYIELRAEMDVLVLISNCPHINNDSSQGNPSPLEVVIWNDSGG